MSNAQLEMTIEELVIGAKDQYPILAEIWEEDLQFEAMDRDLDWEVATAYEEELEAQYSRRTLMSELSHQYSTR